MYLRIKSLTVLMCLISAQALAVSVTWIDGVNPPAAWTIDPNQPGTSDVISFSGPLDFPFHPSSCNAEGALGGTPQISVDSLAREVTLSFVGPPPQGCGAIWAPVSGLQGEFGPLAAGSWTFRSTSAQIPFNIPFTVGTSASTLYVDQDAPGPVHNGTHWYWAFATLQDALSVAIPGDTILVAQGLYRPDQGGAVTSGDRSASFTLPGGITLVGGYAGFGEVDPDAHDPGTFATELSGDLAGDDLYGLLNTGENSYHVVTVQGPGSMVTVIDGVIITSGRANGSSPHHMGGALLVEDADVILTNSVISGNKGAFGGAAAVNQGDLTLVNTRVSGNSAHLYGGGFYALEGSVALTNCLITGNVADQEDVSSGSVLYGLNSSTYINSSTLTDNMPGSGQAISSLGWMFPPVHELIVNNSILYNGGSEVFTNHPASTSVSSTDIEGGWTGAGTGNINADPLFVSHGDWSVEGEWIDGDYHLQNSSPCIDQGSAGLLPADTTDLDLDTDTVEALPLDLDGLARVQGPETDMGVYETLVSTEPPVDANWIVANVYNIYDTPTVPWPDRSVSATFTIYVTIDSTLEELGLSVEAASPAGGDWTAIFNPDPGPLGPGFYSITISVSGQHVDMSQLTMGERVTLAKVYFLYRVLQP